MKETFKQEEEGWDDIKPDSEDKYREDSERYRPESILMLLEKKALKRETI